MTDERAREVLAAAYQNGDSESIAEDIRHKGKRAETDESYSIILTAMRTYAAGAVAAERARVLKLYEQAGIECCMAILESGAPGRSTHQRAKAKATAKGFELATTALKKAIAS